jgi:hypothetical protein
VLYEVSRISDGSFINAAPVVHRSRPGRPWMVYIFGSGDYRKSRVYLARVPLAEVDDPQKSAWRYWTGQDWNEHEQDAAALFVDEPAGVGELSAAWLAPLQRWLLTDQLEDPRGVWFRTAPYPNGPYSAPRLLYHPDWADVGYGSVMHRGWDAGGVHGTDMLYDRGRGEEWGGEYGPYIVSRFTLADGPNRARIAFALSTWNPYQSHLFTAALELSDEPPVEPPAQPPFEADHPTPTQADGVSMLVSTFGPGNFELAVADIRRGLLLRSRDNTQSGLPWLGVARTGLGPYREDDAVHYGGVSMIQSDLPNRPEDRRPWTGRLYVAARCGDRVVYLWREAAPPWKWHGPYPVIAVETADRRMAFSNATGNVVLIRSHHGARHQNWELMSPAAEGGGVLHLWRDNTAEFPLHGDWLLAPRFLQSLGAVDAVTLIESQLTQGVFALEVVARVGSRLWLAWRNPPLQWTGPFPVDVDGHQVVDASGVPALIQSRFGSKRRNFELISPRVGGGLLHLWRNNDSDDSRDWRWRPAPVIDPQSRYRSVALLQSSFGPDPGNLELVARADDGRVMHFWREAATMQWHGPNHVL